MRLSLSNLGRARVCSGAAVLPQIPSRSVAATIGNASHEWIDSAVRSWTSARGHAEVGDIADRWELWGEARATFIRYVRGVGDVPMPESGLTEVPLALLEDGSVVPVRGGHGEYEAPEDAVIAGTLDAMWPERDGEASHFLWPDGGAPQVAPGDLLMLPDWKTGGAEHAPPPRFNWQLKGQALLAARWTGAERVLPMLGLIDGGPVRWEWEKDRHGYARSLGPADFDAIETEIRRVVARVRAQDPAAPEVVTGAHCAYCPARVACPAHVAAPRAMIEAIPDPKAIGPLTDEQARRLLPIVLAVEPARKAALDALKAHARLHGPIALPDGRVWGPGEARRLEFVTEGSFELLRETLAALVGEERALWLAHQAFETSKSALYDAVSVAVDGVNEARRARGEKRITKKSVAEPMFAAMAEAGAMLERTTEEFEARWPEGEGQ